MTTGEAEGSRKKDTISQNPRTCWDRLSSMFSALTTRRNAWIAHWDAQPCSPRITCKLSGGWFHLRSTSVLWSTNRSRFLLRCRFFAEMIGWKRPAPELMPHVHLYHPRPCQSTLWSSPAGASRILPSTGPGAWTTKWDTLRAFQVRRP